VTNEEVKIEKYRAGRQYNLRRLCGTSLTGERWATLQALMQYATLQWPFILERLAKRKSSSAQASKTIGKRKAPGSGAGGSGRSAPKARLVAGTLTQKQKKINMEQRLLPPLS
jgi:hypothetical protein